MSNAGFNYKHFLNSVVFSYLTKIALLALGFAYVVLLANQLGPEKFGLFSYLLDFAGAILALLGMEAFSEVLRVFIPKTSSKELIRKIVWAQLIIAFIIGTVFFVFSGQIHDFIGRGNPGLIQLLALTILFIPVSSIVHAIVIGNRQFGKLLALTIIENASNVGLAIFFVFFLKMGIEGAIWARVSSLALLGIAGFLVLRKSSDDTGESKANIQQVKEYSVQTFITTIFKKISLQAQLIWIGLFVSAQAMGFFYLLQKISIYFIETPAMAINEVLLPFASRTGDNKAFTENLVSKSVKLYMILSIAMAILLLVAAPILVRFFFPSFLNGLELVPLFALYYAMSFDYPLGTLFRAINQPRVLTITYIVSALNSLTIGYFLISRFFVQGLLATMIIGRVLSLAIFVFFVRKSGYQIEFFPRKKDLAYFWVLAVQIIRKIIGKITKQKTA